MVHFSREPFLSWEKKGFDRHLLQAGKKRDGRLPDVPTLYELMDKYRRLTSAADWRRYFYPAMNWAGR